MLKPGDMAPDFDVLTDEGAHLKLSDLRGKTVILYFYPKSDTPGCTKEACSFRDAFPRFDTDRAVVLGISPDDVKAQAKFKAKFNLPFTLLADADHAIAEAYGLWSEKSMYGFIYFLHILKLVANSARMVALSNPRRVSNVSEVDDILCRRG